MLSNFGQHIKIRYGINQESPQSEVPHLFQLSGHWSSSHIVGNFRKALSDFNELFADYRIIIIIINKIRRYSSNNVSEKYSKYGNTHSKRQGKVIKTSTKHGRHLHFFRIPIQISTKQKKQLPREKFSDLGDLFLEQPNDKRTILSC